MSSRDRCLARMKKVLFLSLVVGSLSCNSASAFELKLQCNYSAKALHSNGTVETEAGSAIVDITEVGHDLFIMVEHAGMDMSERSVSTAARAGKSINNFSDKNRWDLTNTQVFSDGRIIKRTQRISVDRNTGGLGVSSVTSFRSGNHIEFNASGNCVKVNNQNRKF